MTVCERSRRQLAHSPSSCRQGQGRHFARCPQYRAGDEDARTRRTRGRTPPPPLRPPRVAGPGGRRQGRHRLPGGGREEEDQVGTDFNRCSLMESCMDKIVLEPYMPSWQIFGVFENGLAIANAVLDILLCCSRACLTTPFDDVNSQLQYSRII